MNCPHCNTPNDPSSRFCVSCGQSLSGQSPSAPFATNELALSPRAVFGIQTGRLLLSLLGLWLLKAILTGLPFVKELSIPKVSISTPSIISSLICLVIIIVSVKYATLLSRLWPQAFPGYPQAVSVWAAIVYLIVLAAAYNGSKPVLQAVKADAQWMMIWQIVLVSIALLISIRASVIAYQLLPAWLIAYRRSTLAMPMVSPHQEADRESS
jgi:hypothetical protein